MDRQAEAFKETLNALRDGASVAHTSIIDKLTAVVESDQSILRLALDRLTERLRPNNPNERHDRARFLE